MIKKTKVTVVTPTYNRARFIKETIESVLAQDHRDFEYVILDDGSTDNTAEIVKPFLKDKRVKYLYHQNQGEAETVNWGWQLARGEYFTQLNSDDLVAPQLFREMLQILEKNENYVVAYPNFDFINERGKRIKKEIAKDWNFLEALRTYECYAAATGTLIRKNAFKRWNKIRDKRFKYVGDTVMYWNMALVGDFIHVPKVLASWRQHPDGISTTRYKALREVMTWFKEFFAKKNLAPKISSLKYYTLISISVYARDLLKKSNLFFKNFLMFYYKLVELYVRTILKLKKYYEKLRF
jgi:glycosyltransferase involved in cell wall biosynthesis